MLKTKNRIIKKEKIKYPILTVILFITLIYLGINAGRNVIKLASFKYKLMQMEIAYANAQRNNDILREEINSYSTPNVITYKVIPQKNFGENLCRSLRY